MTAYCWHTGHQGIAESRGLDRFCLDDDGAAGGGGGGAAHQHQRGRRRGGRRGHQRHRGGGHRGLAQLGYGDLALDRGGGGDVDGVEGGEGLRQEGVDVVDERQPGPGRALHRGQGRGLVLAAAGPGRARLRLDAAVRADAAVRLGVAAADGEVIHQDVVQDPGLETLDGRKEGSMETGLASCRLHRDFLISEGRDVELGRDLGQDILVIL